MRSVSRTERILVDSHNFKLDSVRIEGLLPYPMNTIIQSSFDTQKITIKSGNHEQCVVHMRNRLRFNETIVPLLVFILKNATINDFSIETILNIDWSKVLQDALNSKSLSIRSFSGVLLKFQEAFFFVNKLNYTSKSIYLDGHGCKNFPIDQLISIESVCSLEQKLNYTILDFRFPTHHCCKFAMFRVKILSGKLQMYIFRNSINVFKNVLNFRNGSRQMLQLERDFS